MAGVTVVVPLYNKRESIGPTLKSISEQSVQPLEVLIVDDRSTDGSYELVERLTAGKPNTRVVRQPSNGGPAKARNAGARLASGDWLAFLDADDLWSPAFLEQMIGAARQTGASFGGCGRVQIDHGMGIAEEFLVGSLGSGASVVMDGLFWRAFRNYYPINPSCNLIKRDLFMRAGGFLENMAQREDHALWATLWSMSKFFFVNDTLVQIDKSSSGLSRRRSNPSDLLRMEAALAKALARSVPTRRAGTASLAAYFARMSVAFGRSYAKGLVRGAGRLTDKRIPRKGRDQFPLRVIEIA